MIVIPEHYAEAPHARKHPWSQTEYDDGAGRYYDFKANPELIRTALEDFAPHATRPAVQQFYALLEWLNRPEGPLETNDCAFRPPESHGDSFFRKPLRASGRLQFFFRQLPHNCGPTGITWLLRMFHIYLSLERREVEYAVFETAICPTQYAQIGQAGFRLSVRFSVYGDSEAETYAMLSVALLGLRRTLERIDAATSVPLPEYP